MTVWAYWLLPGSQVLYYDAWDAADGIELAEVVQQFSDAPNTFIKASTDRHYFSMGRESSPEEFDAAYDATKSGKYFQDIKTMHRDLILEAAKGGTNT